MPSPTVPHQALYRRWRAQTFAGIVGQEAVVATLRNGVRTRRLGHGLLFIGPRGTGKTSLARIVAKAVNCLAPVDGEPCDACEPCLAIREGRALDVVELDAASNNKVDDMRELLPRVYTAPADLRRKVFIIDEVQRIKEGWDVLLKTLEEPPDEVLFIFCTTDPAQIRPAVVSRLQRYAFRPLSVAEIGGKLERILEAEALPADGDAVALVAELAAGGMRDAESMLDQLLSSGLERLTADGVRRLLGLADQAAIDGFLDALLRGDALAGIAILDAGEDAGRDPGAFLDQLITRLHEVIVAGLARRPVGGGASASLEGAPPATVASVARRIAALESGRASGGVRFGLEVLLLERVAEPGAAVEAAVRPAAAIRPDGSVSRSPQTRPQAVRSPSASRRSPSAAPSEAEPVGEPPATPPDATHPPATVPVLTAPGLRRGTDDPLDRLRRGWPELVVRLGQNPALRPLIAACRPVEVRDRVVVLGFPEEQAFLREIADRRKPALEDGVTDLLGPGFAVRCVLANLEALDPLPEASAGDDLVASFREIFAGDLADAVEIS